MLNDANGACTARYPLDTTAISLPDPCSRLGLGCPASAAKVIICIGLVLTSQPPSNMCIILQNTSEEGTLRFSCASHLWPKRRLRPSRPRHQLNPIAKASPVDTQVTSPTINAKRDKKTLNANHCLQTPAHVPRNNCQLHE
jgi:hypothetical protein